MPLLREGDTAALEQFKSFVANVAITSCIITFNTWGVIDKLIQLDLLDDSWESFSDNSFKHFLVYLVVAGHGVMRLSRSQAGLGVTFPSGDPPVEPEEPMSPRAASPT